MASNYAYNCRDFKFILKEWLPLQEILAYEKFRDLFSIDDVDVLMDQVDKIAAEIIAPSNTEGELMPARFEDGRAYGPPSFKTAFKFIQENGWGTSNVYEEASVSIPGLLYAPLLEIMMAANPTLTSYLGLSTSAARCLQTFGDDRLRNMFMPKLADGTWQGCMCLTEPTAGSDVGEILSKAYPTDDPAIYKIKGNKIFITAGDGDHADNFIYLYLARVEGAAPGTKGISLFIVPRFWVNEDESFTDNDVVTIGIEDKLGMKGAVTAALSFGENNNCRGWLLGGAPGADGIGEGMKQMFQMMNDMRLGTGLTAMATASNAYFNAQSYCQERVQGKAITGQGGRTAIINHEDVKRMLMVNKSTLEACRAIIARAYYYTDISRHDPDPERRKLAAGKVECLTPICKAYPSDECWGLIAESIQCYGGYGYSEEYPVAQSARDCKINSLWEGTNYIQSMDLVGRKWTQDGGYYFMQVLGEIDEFIKNNSDTPVFGRELANLKRALSAYREMQGSMMNYFQQGKPGMMPLFARRMLTATAQLYGAYCLLEQALIAEQRAGELGESHYDYEFYRGKVLSARYYLRNILPNVWATAEIIADGDTSVLEAAAATFKY